MAISYLVSRDTKGKIRCIKIDYTNEDDVYVIHRSSWQHQGKRIEQPEIVITQGKVKRDTEAQCILQFNALVKSYQDKGYKSVENDPDTYSEQELQDYLPEYNTDSNGFRKHMLAKPIDKVKIEVIDREPYWYASRKIDGLRASFYFDDNTILSASRGGGDYNASTKHITQHPALIEYFKNHPDIILDGELYKHGWKLQKISGAARQEKNVVDCDELQYYVYDIMIPKVSFRERLKLLIDLAKELRIGFDPYHEFKKGDLQLQIVPQVVVHGYNNIMNLHNKYVEEGWEGVVIRNPNSEYKFGSRCNSMIKVKKYKDDCFKVIGIEAGLRGSEDMVFVLETEEGKEFKAKPLGDRATKEEYFEEFESKYKGVIGECKFFCYSEDNVPLQPAFKCFRWDLM